MASSNSAIAENPVSGQPASERSGSTIPPKDSAEKSLNSPNHGPTDSGRTLILAAVPSWLVSMIVHVILLLVLALITLPIDLKNVDNELTLADSDLVRLDEEMPIFELDQQLLDSEVPLPVTEDPFQPETELVTEETIISNANDLDSVAYRKEISPLGLEFAPETTSMADFGGVTGSGVEGRGAASRSRLLREAGGTAESERAVRMALEWLARHQRKDGSWSLDFRSNECNCGDPGTHTEAQNAATALALLPFLGAGHTHTEGKYKELVGKGLYYILSHQEKSGSLADLRGNLYAHGLCTITLSEAYAMTRDEALLIPTQAAINFIGYAQDPVGGGWRYVPKQPGDTSVVGWQLMALKSGKMAYLKIDNRVLAGASKFLDSVQTDEGSAYGYADPGSRNTTTAIGLLCRMYMGWGRDNAALIRGVERMSQSGPSKVNMYYNYYATQVMRHYEGPMWEKWNKKMRDFLIATQETKGHRSGSWHMGSDHAPTAGGRLYSTSLSTMVLEVYYRHLPIYRQQATDDDFEL